MEEDYINIFNGNICENKKQFFQDLFTEWKCDVLYGGIMKLGYLHVMKYFFEFFNGLD